MNDCKLRNQYGELLDPTQPLPVDSAGAKQLSVKSETITYKGKVATGAVAMFTTEQRSIVGLDGDRVASHWLLEKNKVYETYSQKQSKGSNWVLSLVETAGSAEIVVYDASKDLESMFEGTTTLVKRFVLRAEDNKGKVLYGWVFGVAVSGSTYTLDIVNNRLSETRNWVGDTTAFDHTNVVKVEVYRYQSSLAFGTGTAFTEEVVCPREFSKSFKSQIEFAEGLEDGQYFVDYARGLVMGKRADTTASEAITYNTYSDISSGGSSGGASSSKRTIAHATVAIGAGATALSATSLPVYTVSMQNKSTNDSVYIGATGVDSTTGHEIVAGGAIGLENVDLADVFVNGTAANVVKLLYTY